MDSAIFIIFNSLLLFRPTYYLLIFSYLLLSLWIPFKFYLLSTVRSASTTVFVLGIAFFFVSNFLQSSLYTQNDPISQLSTGIKFIQTINLNE